MADFLSIQVTGNQPLIERLNAAINRLQQPRGLLEALGARLVANIERRFDTKTDPSGQRWDKLADGTLERYARQDKGRRRGTLLERTGQMRNSLVAIAARDQVEVGMNRLTDGGNWSVPLLHETGTRRMPRRGIFLADPDAGALGAGDEEDLQLEIAEYLDEIFGA